MHYTREFAIPLSDYRIIDHNAWVYAENIPGALNGKKLRVDEMMADMGGSTFELLAKASDQGALDQELTAEDRERLLDYLVCWGIVTPGDLDYEGSNRRGFTELPGVTTPGTEGRLYPLQDLLPYAQSIVDLHAGYLSVIPTYERERG
jgi:monoamine oxidase